MQVKLDDEIIFEITEHNLKIYEHAYIDPMAEIKRRLQWIIERNTLDHFGWMKEEWMKKFENDQSIKSIPTDPIELRKLIMSHPDYKNAIQRDAERKAREDKVTA